MDCAQVNINIINNELMIFFMYETFARIFGNKYSSSALIANKDDSIALRTLIICSTITVQKNLGLKK